MPSRKKSIFQEKRQAERFSTHKASILLHGGREIYTTIIDFSASGVGFLSASPLEIGTEAELRFLYTEDGSQLSINIPIEVVRTTDHEDEHIIGAVLQHVTFEYRQMLKKLCEMHAQIN